MPIESSEDLVFALQSSGLFTPERFAEMVRDLTPLPGEVKAVERELVRRRYVTAYQLGKIQRGKPTDLFIGPYIVLNQVGEGGMGHVFRARQARMDRTVALKVVRSALAANPIVRGRYEREVQAATKLDHPNIVKLYDAGESNGRFYLAMEFVDGIDLTRLMQQFQPLEIIEACEYARQAALGLQHAHESGFIHRDVKPGNIVVAGERHLPNSTEPAVVKLLDLGLARAIDPEDMVLPDLTRPHTTVGTPDYISPEQAKGTSNVDPRSDQYSLGCTLYYLLTGSVPFPSGTTLEKLMKHQFKSPTPVQEMRRGIPDAVAELLMRLLEKEPDKRFQNMGEFAAAMEPHCRYPQSTPTPPAVQSPTGTARPVRPKTPAPAEPSSSDSLPIAETLPEERPQRSRSGKAKKSKFAATGWVLLGVAVVTLIGISVWAATILSK